ncbi:MAG: hypothetical protein QJR09_08085 [Micrococcus sp.]|nr:hypothetical protein [Micrococcus sp.]
MTTRDRIRTAAEAAGWNIERQAFDDTFHKGRNYVHVRYSVRATVVDASTPSRYVHGQGKADRVLELLTKATR